MLLLKVAFLLLLFILSKGMPCSAQASEPDCNNIDRELTKFQHGKRQCLAQAEKHVHCLHHGKEQLEALLHDRPAMLPYVSKDDPIWNWTVRHLAGEGLGFKVFWDSNPPSLQLASHYVEFESEDNQQSVPRKGFIRIADRNVHNKKLTGSYLWSCLVFELYNLENFSQFRKAESDAADGKLSKDTFVRTFARLEYEAAKKTNLFYLTQWLPLAKMKGLPSIADDWYANLSPFEIDFKHLQSTDYLKHYESRYDEIVNE